VRSGVEYNLNEKRARNNLFSGALCTGAAGTVPDVAHQNGLKGERENEK